MSYGDSGNAIEIGLIFIISFVMINLIGGKKEAGMFFYEFMVLSALAFLAFDYWSSL